MFGHVSETKGLQISPPMNVFGGKMVSIRGPLSVVLTHLEMHAHEICSLLAFGQNGAREGGTPWDHVEAHILVLNESRMEMCVPYAIIAAQYQDGFDYAHMFTLFGNGVRVGIFGTSFKQNPHASRLLDALAHLTRRHKEITSNPSNTLFFVGRE